MAWLALDRKYLLDALSPLQARRSQSKRNDLSALACNALRRMPGALLSGGKPKQLISPATSEKDARPSACRNHHQRLAQLSLLCLVLRAVDLAKGSSFRITASSLTATDVRSNAM